MHDYTVRAFAARVGLPVMGRRHLTSCRAGGGLSTVGEALGWPRFHSKKVAISATSHGHILPV